MADWRRIKELYAAAGELRGGARGAYLDEACGGDADLRAQLEELLTADEQADSEAFLADESSASGHAGAASGPPPAAVPERTIGRYELLEQIGEGGFGEVYRAAQREPVQREVALKLIKLGMDTRQVVARFEAERQALALMDHPDIARVLDGGASEAGRPYFVMELVAGLPITEYCDRHDLSLAERLRLFGRVCHAVQHAHQKGVVHRDIKPGNVLVASGDTAPLVKVIDFGIAKALHGPLSEATLTDRPQYVGTPAYMSPEQAEPGAADIDTRADVYSLGALLFELLTGGPPFAADRLRSAGFTEALRIIREESPQRPSTHDRRLRGDLDWILLKALEKDRARRYETAAALADDIARYLRDEPVTAGPPTAVYRLRKFARRNRGLLVSVATIAFLLVGGATASTLGFWQARVAQQRAEESRDAAEAVTRFLVDVLTAPDPYELGRDVPVREVLAHAGELLETRFADQPEVRARLHLTLGRVYVALGRPDEAAAHIPRACELYDALHGVDSEPALRARSILAELHDMQGRYAEAEGVYAAEVTFYEARDGRDALTTLEAECRLANNLLKQGRLAAALELHRAVVPRMRAVLGENHPRTLRARNDLAVALDAVGAYDEAEPIYLDVLAAREELHGRKHPHTQTTVHCLAALYEITGRLEQAEVLYAEALATVRALEGPEHPHALTVMSNLASVYDKQRRFEESEALLRDVLARRIELLGDEHPEVMLTRNNLANTLELAGRFEQALPIQERVARYYVESLGQDVMRTQIARANLARIYNGLERFDEAAVILEDALARMRRMHPEHGFTAAVARHLGVTRMGQGRFPEAEVLLHEARDGMARAMGPGHQLTRQIEQTLVELAERRAAGSAGAPP